LCERIQEKFSLQSQDDDDDEVRETAAIVHGFVRNSHGLTEIIIFWLKIKMMMTT
jgi:hypothetical protein